jgi:hypothetical protein
MNTFIDAQERIYRINQKISRRVLDVCGGRLVFESTSMYLDHSDWDTVWRTYSIGLKTLGNHDPLMKERCSELHRDRKNGELVLVFTFSFSTKGELRGDVPRMLLGDVEGVLVQYSKGGVEENTAGTPKAAETDTRGARKGGDRQQPVSAQDAGGLAMDYAAEALIKQMSREKMPGDGTSPRSPRGASSQDVQYEVEVPPQLLVARMGMSDLHIAAKRGDTDAVKRLLVEDKVDVEEIDGDLGWTALHHAAWCGNLEVVRMLVDEFGANMKAVDEFYRTPFDVGVESYRKKLFPVAEESRQAIIRFFRGKWASEGTGHETTAGLDSTKAGGDQGKATPEPMHANSTEELLNERKRKTRNP